jgi:hypothetical protein
MFRGIKRDKLIAVSIFSICLILYISGEIRIRAHNSKAKVYFGTHQLVNYNNSPEYSVEILPNNEYKLFKHSSLKTTGEWELSISSDNSTRLLLDGQVFGLGEYEIK